MADKSLAYAEVTLGVHLVYDEARDLLKQHEELMQWIAASRSTRRLIEEQIQNLETDIQLDETGKHATMSATALKEKIKLETARNPSHRDLRTRLREVQNELDNFELRRSSLDNHLKAVTARMNELGGYLQYLAAIKLSRTGTPPTQPGTQGEQA